MKATDTMTGLAGTEDREYVARGVAYVFEYYERTADDDGGAVVITAIRDADDAVIWSGSTTYFDTMRVIDVVRDARESAAMAKADGY